MRYLMILSILFVSAVGFSQTKAEAIKTVKKEQVDLQKSKFKAKKVSKAKATKASPKATKQAPAAKNKYVRKTRVQSPAMTRKGKVVKYAKAAPAVKATKKKPAKKAAVKDKRVAAPLPKF